jgi:Fe-S cluster assembly scaffold protein SufB
VGARPLEDRVAEVKAKREKTRKKLDQYDEQIKRLEKKDAEEKRKQRTHSLIVCGAEIAALFEKVLDQDEIHSVVNFLREQRDLGNFTFEKTEVVAVETTQEISKKTNDDFGDLFRGFFDF